MKRKQPLVQHKTLFGSMVRQLRTERKISGAELCRRSGGLDPRTLTALEKGRIKNPSLETMRAVAGGLGLPVSDLFRQFENRSSRYLYAGTPKGFFQMDFTVWGIKIVSFTPLIPDFFCGKFIFGSRKRLTEALLPPLLPIFVSGLVGRFEVTAGAGKVTLKEGDNLFLKGGADHMFQNLLERESVLMVVTAPSFLALRQNQSLPILFRKR